MKKYNLSKPYNPEVLEKLHRVQISIISDFVKVCDKYDLKYFAVYGTALGAIRHKGFIPWDDDVDVAMLREDYDRFCSVFHKELGTKYNLLTPELDKRYTCTVTHMQRKGTKFVSQVTKGMKCEQCIDLDIFPLDYVADNMREQKKQARQTNIWGKLLFLRGTAVPVIPISGLKGNILGIICMVIHAVLKLLRISPKYIYKKFKYAATRYNDKKGEYVTSFEYSGGLKDKVRAVDLFPLEKVKFEEIEIYIPNNNHEFLAKVYGDYMQLPPENERVNHMPLIIQFEGEEPLYG